jgi:DNA-binding NarL/FixJ family response regulator
VLKDRPVQEVIEGIRAAAAGHSHISSQLAMPLLRRLRESSPSGIGLDAVDLGTREHQVLARVAEGKADDEIAETLGMSPGDVRALVSSLLMKLRPATGVRARTTTG